MGRFFSSKAVLLVPFTALLTLPAHPPLHMPPWGWVALAPVAWGLAGPGPGTLGWLGLGWGWGVIFYGLRLEWLPDTLGQKGGIPPETAMGFSAAVVLALGLFPALAMGVTRWARLRHGLNPLVMFPVLYALQDALLGVFPFGGVPWGTLAATQTDTLAARWLVPWGSSLLVLAMALGGSAWAAWGSQMVKHPTVKHWAHRPAWSLFSGGLLLLVTGLVSAPVPATPPPAQPESPRVVLVPGNLPVGLMANPGLAPFQRDDQLARSRAGVEHLRNTNDWRGPVLVVWPESAIAGLPAQGPMLGELERAAKDMGALVLWGANGQLTHQGIPRGTNSAWLVGGPAVLRYDKRFLVAFGEYVPWGFRWMLGRKVTAGDQDDLAGTSPPVLAWGNERVGVAICQESTLPLAFAQAAQGTRLVAVLANDAWLPPRGASHHLRLSALRGLETGRPVAVAANGGYSGVLWRGRPIPLAAPTQTGLPAPEPFWLASALPPVENTPWLTWGYLPLFFMAGLLTLGAWLLRRPPEE
ncbi:MAG: apolipoprotein N-acyltransferase [Deltaproteobacteria bacterium]|nr:apolipoprotein N-acyltransferase [Deltaproteobacteria bacterium]